MVAWNKKETPFDICFSMASFLSMLLLFASFGVVTGDLDGDEGEVSICNNKLIHVLTPKQYYLITTKCLLVDKYQAPNQKTKTNTR